jgi:hypothetical protein
MNGCCIPGGTDLVQILFGGSGSEIVFVRS